MKKTLAVLVISIITTLFACMPEPQYDDESGKNIVPSDTLELMIYDIHLADAIITSKILKAKDNSAVDSLIYQSIYDKYSYSREDFEQTLLFYTHNHLDSLNAMYDRVISKFHIAEGEIYK
jgi:hypothetical protein